MHTTWYGQSCSNEAEAFRLLRLSKLNCVVSAETLFVTFKMQVIARFIVNCDNVELNHSHVGAGNVTPTELRLEANRYFSNESTKEGSCSLTRRVVLVDLKCWNLFFSKRSIFWSSQCHSGILILVNAKSNY